MSNPIMRYAVTVYYRESADAIDEREENTLILLNHFKITRTELARRIYDAGILTLIKEIAELNQMKPLDKAIFETRQAIHARKRQAKLFEGIYEEYGPTGFMDWCSTHLTEEADKDAAQRFLQQFTWQDEDLRKAERAERWLRELLGDGLPHLTEEIRKQAIADELIKKDSEKDWGWLRVKAHRMGLTQGPQYGMWQLPRSEKVSPVGYTS